MRRNLATNKNKYGLGNRDGKINSVEYASHFIGQESEKGKVKENKETCFFVFFKSKKTE